MLDLWCVSFVVFVIHNSYFLQYCLTPVNNHLLVNVAILVNGGRSRSKPDILRGLQDIFADYTCSV